MPGVPHSGDQTKLHAQETPACRVDATPDMCVQRLPKGRYINVFSISAAFEVFHWIEGSIE